MNRIVKVLPLTLLYILLILAFFLSCSSCTPIKRLNRLQKKHPTLFNRENDTVRLVDTIQIMIPGTTADTNLSILQLMKDTVTIYKNGVTTKLFIYKDTLYLQNQTDTIYKTIIRKIDVPYKRYVTNNLPRDKLRWYDVILIIGAMISTVTLIQILLDKKNKSRKE